MARTLPKKLNTDRQRTIKLDRGLLEAIKDPLTHLIRNAIDHGIETPTVVVSGM